MEPLDSDIFIKLTPIYYENLVLSTELVTEGSIQQRKKYEADVAQVSPSPERIQESCVIIHSKYFSISDWLKSVDQTCKTSAIFGKMNSMRGITTQQT